jgi:hypothetical protein
VLLQAPAMVHAGEGMPPGTTRDLVLGVARPVDLVTGALRLDRPASALAGVFGNKTSDSSSSELLTGTGRDELPPVVTDAEAGDGQNPAGAAATIAEVRQPTASDPLRMLVTGDSMTESVGPAIAGSAGRAMRTETDTRFGTGLVRPDFFDWAAYARTQVAERDPEAVVVAMGGNDGQGFTMPDGAILSAGTPEWVEEYRRRAIVVMQIWTGGGKRRVYWMSMPPARSSQLDDYYRKINEAVADAARRVPGVTYVDVAGRLSDNGRYNDYLRDDSGNTVLARTRDGVHLTLDGARMAATIVLSAIRAEWRIDG